MPLDLDFITMVAKMRFFQNQYIRNRSQWSLDQAKKYENLVDQALDKIDMDMAIGDTEKAHKQFKEGLQETIIPKKTKITLKLK